MTTKGTTPGQGRGKGTRKGKAPSNGLVGPVAGANSSQQAPASPWRNRIIGHGQEAPENLLANPGNWRLHPRDQQGALAGVLEQVGIVQSVIVNERTGFVVDGHLRVMLAMRAHVPLIPICYVDLSAEEEALVLATIDPISAMAKTDQDLLDALLKEVVTQDPGLQELLNDLASHQNEGPEQPAAPPEPSKTEVKVVCPECGHCFEVGESVRLK